MCGLTYAAAALQLLFRSGPRTDCTPRQSGGDELPAFHGRVRDENGGEKLVHGCGGIVSLRAEQNSAR